MSLIQQSKRDAKRTRTTPTETLPNWAFDDKGAPLVVAPGDAPAKPVKKATASAKPKSVAKLASAPPEVRYLTVDQLAANPFQPRRHFAEHELEELASSLREHGQLQPILVRPYKNGFQIIAGERRWRAAKRIPGFQLLCVVRVMNDMEALVASHHENAKRVNVRAFDNALFYARYGLLLLGNSATAIDKALKSGELPEEFPYDDVAKAVGMSARSVRRYTDLLRLSKVNRSWFDTAPPTLQPNAAEEPVFVPNEKHGRALLLLRDYPKAQKQLREEIETLRLSGDAALAREKELRPNQPTEMNHGGTEGQSNQAVTPTGSKSKKETTPTEMLQGAAFLIEKVRHQIAEGKVTTEEAKQLAPEMEAINIALRKLKEQNEPQH